MRIYKGDMFYADLTPVVGCEQGGIRPVLIIQNDIGNRYSPTVIVAAITSRIENNHLPTHIWLCSQQYGLRRNSLVLLEQGRISLEEFQIADKFVVEKYKPRLRII